MSLARFMLRALALNALLPQPGDADIITLANDRVFDSMLDPKQFTLGAQDIPAITVYTDEDDSDLLTRQANSGPYLRHVNLRVELVIGSFDSQMETNNFIFAVPTTDAQLEARLDLFEQQVRWALLNFPTREASDAFRAYVVQISHISSHVQRDEGSNNRFAARVLNFKCRINDDCAPSWGFENDPREPPPKFDEDDFALVPPWLTQMLVASQNAPSMRNVIEALGGRRSPAVLVPMFQRMGVRVDEVYPAADPTLLANLNRTQGPDGRIELQSVWSINPQPAAPAFGNPVTDPEFDVMDNRPSIKTVQPS